MKAEPPTKATDHPNFNPEQSPEPEKPFSSKTPQTPAD